MQISTFLIADETFAIPSLVVEEYFRPLPVTKVPGADPRIDGLVNIRGRTAVVVSQATAGEMILLETSSRLVKEAIDLGLKTFEESVVLNVDQASQIYHLVDEALHPSPPHVNQNFVDGVVNLDDLYFTMISVEKLIQHLIQGTSGELS
jgi:purine-binding chemotaxis protein CheW